MESVSRISATLWQIAVNLGDLGTELWQLGSNSALVLLWIALWLWAVNWKKLWPVLGKGAWAPLLLLCVLVALVWSRIAPGSCPCGLPAFWWQLGSTLGLVAVALVCGWLQGLFHWAPAEIDLSPPAHGHGHDHGHH
jgi:hypothetical protein